MQLKNIKKKFRFLLITAISVTLIGSNLAACNGGGTDTGSQNTFIFGKPKDAVTLDPGDITDGESSAISQNIFETLVRYKPESTEVEPALAESWETSEDGLEWTFKLRENVIFHDGTNFDAEAVKFNYDRQKNQDNPHRFTGKFEYWNLFFGVVEEIEAVDSLTVKFTLSRKDPTFLSNMALFTMGIVSPAAIQEKGQDIFKNPVGTGPFKFGSWIQNEKIQLLRFDEYWGEPAGVENLIFKPVADNSVRLLELETGAIHGMDGINPDDVERINEDQNLKLLTQPGMNVGYLALNMDKPPLDNHQVRLAINHAVNKEGMVNAFFAEGLMGIPAKNPLPPTLWGYNDDIEPYPYDVEKAKQLIQESGVDLSRTLELWAMPVARPYMPQPQRIAESIQADLKEIGINTRIVNFEWGTYLNKVANGEHDMCLLGWIGDNGDPDNFLYTLLSSKNTEKGSSSNYAFYRNEEMDTYLENAKTTLDQDERTENYLQAQEVFHRDVPWVPLFHSTQVAAFRENVEGYKLHPTGAKLFRDVHFTSEVAVK